MPSSEKEEHDLTRELFVKDLISCIEAQNEVTKSEEETQKGIALKCVGKMKFDYAEVSSKELQSLSREVDLMVDRVRERGDLEANGRVDDEGVEIEFDLKVLENISVGANKEGMDGVVERENFARRDRDFDDGNEVYVKRDGFRKLAIQVFVEFASFLIEGAEERANAVEGILGDLNDEEGDGWGDNDDDDVELEDVMKFAEENGKKAMISDENDVDDIIIASKDDDDDDDDVANWIPLENNVAPIKTGGLVNNSKKNATKATSAKKTKTYSRIEKAQFLLRHLTPALIGADDNSRVSDGSAPYVSRKTTETLVRLFETLSKRMRADAEKNITQHRTMRTAAMNCLRSRFLVNPTEINSNECLKRIMKALKFGEYAKRTKAEKKMNEGDGAKEDDIEALALLAHLAARFADKNALGANFTVLGQLENSTSTANLANARRSFAPLVADSLAVIAARFWIFSQEDSDQSSSQVDEEDSALNACALLLSYAFTNNNSDAMMLSSGCVASIAAYFASKGVIRNDSDSSLYYAPGSAAARRCISLGIVSSKGTREFFSKAPACVDAAKLEAFTQTSHGIIWSLAIDNDEEEASKRLKSISENHSNSIEMLNTILLLSACFASAGNNNNNDGIPSSALWRKEGAFHETLVDILASTKEQEKRLVEDAKRRLAERRGQNEKKCNESDEEEDDNSNISSSPTTISSDAKVDPESEKARDIASASARVLKDLVAASVLGDSKAIRKSD
jgi:hypothetical protein